MIDPIAFELGPISVRWYGVLIASAFMIGTYGSGRLVKKAGMDEDDFYSIVLWVVLFSIIGARLYYVLFSWQYYAAHPDEIIAVWEGGLAIHGGLIAGTLTLLLGSRKYGMPFWTLADILAPFVILGQAIGRWGNYFNQEAYGYEVDPDKVPTAMFIDGAWRHPTFLYESLWNITGFVLLSLFYRCGKAREGEVGLAYVMYYSFGRFFIEGFRTDSLMLGPLRTAQVISLLLFIGAGIILMLRRKKHS